MKGEIQLIIGPMFSGKTSELIRRLLKYNILKIPICTFRNSIDTRTETESLVTHDNKKFVNSITTDELLPHLETVTKYDVVGIDEGQFFCDLIEFTKKCVEMGKVVIVAGLDAQFNGQPFCSIVNLVPLAEKIDKLTAICATCQDEASFTKRICESKESILIGGTNYYQAACRKCWLK